jgi:hypothetical protein
MEVNKMMDIETFIRGHRSNQANFEKLYDGLEKEINGSKGSGKYVAGLKEIKSKAAEEYKTLNKQLARPGRNLKNLSASLRRL